MFEKRVCLQITTWKEDEEDGLFDYRSQQNQLSQFKSSKYSFPKPAQDKSHYYFIYQNKSKAQLKNFKFERRMIFESNPLDSRTGNTCGTEYKMIGGFKLEHKVNESGRYKVYLTAIRRSDIPVKGKQSQQEMDSLPYWVIRSLSNWTVKADQVIKFGRIQMKIDHTCIDIDHQEDANLGDILNLDQMIKQSFLSKENEENNNQVNKCRICFVEEDREDINNILVNPCKCRGSIEFVHIGCLRQWLMKRVCKISLQFGGNLRVSKNHCCELCKMNLPSRIIKNSKIISLARFIQEDNTPYICFASINFQNSPGYDRFFLNFSDGNEVKIGRQQNSGMYLTDQTVSRKHSIMTIQDTNCILKDDESKYGTLVYQKDHEEMLGRNEKAFQIRNSVFLFSYRK